jgi:hypothetical protein
MTVPPKKTRRDSYRFTRPSLKGALTTITDEQHQQLCYWLLRTKLTYPDIIERIREEWKVKITANMLSGYYRTHIASYLIAQRQRNIDVVLKVNSDLAKNPAEFVPASVDSLKRMAFMLANDPSPDPKAIKIVFELILRFNEQDLRRNALAVKLRKIYLLERKAAAAEDAARNTTLSDSDFADRMRKIFKQNALPNGTQNGHAEKEKASDRDNAITA